MDAELIQEHQPEEKPFTERARVKYTIVGRGQRVHYSPGNDDTLCGREVSGYLDLFDAVTLFDKGYELCIPCHRSAEKRAKSSQLTEPKPTSAETAVEDNAPREIVIGGPYPGPALVVRADQVAVDDLVFGAFMYGVTVAEATPGGALIHAAPYLATPGPFASWCGCVACEQYAAEHTGPGITLAHSTPWGTCDVVPADAPVIIRPATPLGCRHADAQHPAVRAALAVLGDMSLARITSEGTGTAGVIVEPRGTGVAAYTYTPADTPPQSSTAALMATRAIVDGIRTRLHAAGWAVEQTAVTRVAAWQPSPPESTLLTDAEVYAAYTKSMSARSCLHGRAPAEEVYGDPAAACARKEPTQRAGVFGDEGCLFVADCAVEAAMEAVALTEAEHDGPEYPAAAPPYVWHVLCAVHEDQEQRADACEHCPS